MKPVKIGLVGCGNISNVYFQQCKTFEILETVACADLVEKRAREKAKKYGVPKACSLEDLLADSEIEIVVNLTIPEAHADMGRHVELSSSCERPAAHPLGLREGVLDE